MVLFANALDPWSLHVLFAFSRAAHGHSNKRNQLTTRSTACSTTTRCVRAMVWVLDRLRPLNDGLVQRREELRSPADDNDNKLPKAGLYGCHSIIDPGADQLAMLASGD